MLAIFQISLSCCFFFFRCCLQKECFQEIRTHERKKEKRGLLKASQLAHISCVDPGARRCCVAPRFRIFMQQSKRDISEVRTVMNSGRAVVRFASWLFYRFEILEGKGRENERAEPEFPGGSVSLKSQLVRTEERRGISSCVFIHSNQESAEREREAWQWGDPATLERNE